MMHIFRLPYILAQSGQIVMVYRGKGLWNCYIMTLLNVTEDTDY